MFGDEDVINSRPHTVTARCLTTTAVLYCIKAEEFLIKFGRDDKTWKMIVKRICQKDLETKSKIKMAIVH